MLKVTVLALLSSMFFSSILVAGESFEEKSRAASLPSTSVEDLQRYANDNDWRIRLIIARRQTTPANILIGLANDPRAEVRAALAHNLRAPRAAVAPLVNDPDESVRLSLAHCGYTPPDLLEKLVKDSSEDVRKQAVVNLNLPLQTLKMLARQDSDLSDRAKTMLQQRSDEEAD